MKNLTKLLFLGGVIVLTALSCEKEEADFNQCGCESETIEVYENVSGTVRFRDSIYSIKLHSANKRGVLPCEEWSDEFKVVGLEVILSGELKKICPTGKPNTKVSTPHPITIKKISIKNKTE